MKSFFQIIGNIILNLFFQWTRDKKILVDKDANSYNVEEGKINPEDEADRISDKELEDKIIKPELPLWAWSVKIQHVTSSYGWRILRGQRNWHNGTDYTGRNETAYAPCDVIVSKVLLPDKEYPVVFEYNPKIYKFDYIKGIPKGRAWTPYVIATCAFNPNIRFVYKHVDSLVEVGDYVDIGYPVAKIGNLGYSMGPHLHFEVHIRANENAKWYSTDPHKFIPKKIAEMKKLKDK